MTDTPKRDEARRQILRRVNRFILAGSRRPWWPPYPARLLGSRQIQQAVCVARRNGLVDDELLAAAGFRGARR